MDKFQHDGWCPICEKNETFISEHSWFRDHLLCSGCGSIPRERAIFKIIKDYFPDYKNLMIHETSPGVRGASIKLQKECIHYTTSQYFPSIPSGSTHPSGYRCENLEALTFSDNFFDVFISQDVMEHIFNPEKAFKEIVRVLKPGGAHIFTVPIINKTKKSERWASMSDNGEIIYHHEPEYHGNPVDAKGSLVTMHWGYDIASLIQEVAKMPTVIIQIDDIDKGIRAEYIDVLVSIKQY
ncbi:class I SAM-dependent methyltransferase [Candidatus Venteria ishoeyi]|uniref:class I SAM-dependent methyltransferase n=1 Tax=Candidatus Venteria ishoeyi TaxID=1899563 RepID=UPI0025A5B9CA|nr:class I SAM-dependent methyltransferase [Candidatus Venteria ishoeyi]MDM8546313.1 class I SAM-dependent methyltransferase [Candidatus Venteria ishoeyi]